MEKTKDTIEKEFAAWLGDLAAEDVCGGVDFVQTFETMGLPGNGFIIRFSDGEEFEVKVMQSRGKR